MILKKIIITTGTIGCLLLMTSISVSASVHSHSSGTHSSVHTSLSRHVSMSRGAVASRGSISRSTGHSNIKSNSSRTVTTSRGASFSNKGLIASQRQIINSSTNSAVTSKKGVREISTAVSHQMPKTKATKQAIQTTIKSTTYKDLNSVTQKADYMLWTAYNYNFPHHYRYYHYHYYWMPFWLWQSNRQEAQKIKEAIKDENMKWIKVDNATISIPKKLYKKIQVGDNIELIDNSNIKVNGIVYNFSSSK